jgi:hypothetical protein
MVQNGSCNWDAQINQVTHLRGGEALNHLSHLRQSSEWGKEGYLVGDVVYIITVPSSKKSKKSNKTSEDQDKMRKPSSKKTVGV